MFEVPIQDGRADDDGQGKHYELDWNDLRAVEALECFIDILDLHNRRSYKYGQQRIRYRRSQSFSDAVGEHTGHALGAECCISAE